MLERAQVLDPQDWRVLYKLAQVYDRLDRPGRRGPGPSRHAWQYPAKFRRAVLISRAMTTSGGAALMVTFKPKTLLTPTSAVVIILTMAGIALLSWFAATPESGRTIRPTQSSDRPPGPLDQPPALEPSPFHFTDLTHESGIDFAYRNGEEAGLSTILESLGGGVAILTSMATVGSTCSSQVGGSVPEVLLGFHPARLAQSSVPQSRELAIPGDMASVGTRRRQTLLRSSRNGRRLR